jgi:hypothetical protein
MIRAALLVLLASGLVVSQPAGAQAIGDSRAPTSTRAPAAAVPSQPMEAQPDRPMFGSQAASGDVHRIADWVAASGDNRGLPFMIVDKRQAKVFLFDARFRILGAAPALLGLGRGDDSVPGIGKRRLAAIAPGERTTPAGRFEAALGYDLEQDVLWIDYDAALSLHRVIVGNPSDHRHERLASPTPLDNRISYGCINVPAAFYDRIVVPAFTSTVGIVYILPETSTLAEVFAIDGGPAQPPRGVKSGRGH